MCLPYNNINYLLSNNRKLCITNFAPNDTIIRLKCNDIKYIDNCIQLNAIANQPIKCSENYTFNNNKCFDNLNFRYVYNYLFLFVFIICSFNKK